HHSKAGPQKRVHFVAAATECPAKAGYNTGRQANPPPNRKLYAKERATMAVLTITKDNFNTEVLNSDKPVLIDFWASWCGRCRMMSRVVDDIAETTPAVKVGKVNVDEQPALAARFGVQSIPTLIVFKNGQNVGQSLGAKPKGAVLDFLRQTGAL